jgi:anti-anti-sigma factor
MTLEKDRAAPAVDLDAANATGSPQLRVFVSGGAGQARVVLAGELDDATAGHLNHRLREVTAELAGDLSIDLSLLTFIDSTGLAVLVQLHKRVQALGWSLIVVEPTARAYRLLEITGLDQVLTIQPAAYPRT